MAEHSYLSFTAASTRMSTIVEYTRPTGQRRTYRIAVDDRGSFQISLNDRVLKRGRDVLIARGLRAPCPEANACVVKYAKAAVDFLIGMKEE